VPGDQLILDKTIRKANLLGQIKEIKAMMKISMAFKTISTTEEAKEIIAISIRARISLLFTLKRGKQASKNAICNQNAEP